MYIFFSPSSLFRYFDCQTFRWCMTGISSGIYIGTIIGALPQMWLMKRFTTSKYIGVNVFMWGVLTMVNAFVTSCRRTSRSVG